MWHQHFQPPNDETSIKKNLLFFPAIYIFLFSLSLEIYILAEISSLMVWHYILGEQGAPDRKYRFWLSQSTSYSFLLQAPISIYFCPNHIASRQRCHPHLPSDLWRQFWSKLTRVVSYKGEMEEMPALVLEWMTDCIVDLTPGWKVDKWKDIRGGGIPL